MASEQVARLHEKGYWSASEAARKAGYNVTSVYRLVENGSVHGMRVGKRWYVQARSFLDYLGPEGRAQLDLTGEWDAVKE